GSRGWRAIPAARRRTPPLPEAPGARRGAGAAPRQRAARNCLSSVWVLLRTFGLGRLRMAPHRRGRVSRTVGDICFGLPPAPVRKLGGMATETARRRARAEIPRLARADLDNDGFRAEAAAVLRKAIGFDWWCWTLLDPAADLPTRHLGSNPIISGALRPFFRMLPNAARPSPAGHA